MKTSAHNYTALLLLFITFLTSASSCKKDDPVGPEELKPGRRDYVWTVDTMMPTPFNMVRRMWGDAEDNIWAVGCAGDFDKVIWHYDGENWSMIPNPEYIDPSCVFGFDKKNIWIGGSRGSFWKYNGISWIKTDEIKIMEFPKLGIENIWGDSPNDIYAVGIAFQEEGDSSRAVLMHYNGKSWGLVKIPEIRGNFFDLKKDIKGSGLSFISFLLWDPMGPDSSKIFTFDGNNLKEIYAGRDIESERAGVFMMSQKVYLKIGKKIYRYTDNKLILWQDLSNSDYLGGMWGRNEKDFFYVTKNKGIGHYNGTDFITIYNNFSALTGAVITDKAVFFQTFDSEGRNIFLTGKLR